ncbi:uncharacterized protein LOC110380802 isoform X1 [Helicoverpa armigera]|uniref:uncharacterized protein LOC110380802 isoform X1 n=1 Tax=Helicoverpa armigera TaxID=29058 RepID=UPI0030836C2B
MKWQLQWKIRVPWGTLALTSRGHPDGEPVFCVHGRQDSSSVFGPLVDLMPNMNHYVCLDMPGNGLSDGFPPGPKLMRFHFLMAMELAIAHLGWDHFIFIGHSMGCEQGLFFNAIHPNRITKMVLLDANPTLMRMQVEDPAEYQRAFFDNYYEHFHRENFERKTHTRVSAMRSLARARDLNDSQCADLLQRNFHSKSEAAQWHPIEKWHPNEAIAPRVMLILNDKDRITDIIKEFTKEEQRIAKLTGVKPNQADRGKRLTEYIVRNQLGVVDNSRPKTQMNEEAFREIMENEDYGYLSWDNRLKNLAPTNYGNEYYFEIFKNIPPTLLVHASDGAKNIPRDNNWREGAKQLLDKMASLENFHRVNVEGLHDVHYTHPEKVAPHVIKFLENKVNSKL